MPPLHQSPDPQLSQIKPPNPQKLAVFPVLQTPAETQPVQQIPPWQLPPVQDAPLALLPVAQMPVAQDTVLQGLVEAHLVQDTPAPPHLVRSLPVWHFEPSQQPLQQAPLRHLPPLQVVPLLLAVSLQTPEEVQLPTLQS